MNEENDDFSFFITVNKLSTDEKYIRTTIEMYGVIE